APVSGTIVHADVVIDGAYGYSDFANWVPTDGNPGRAGSDFSQFQNFQRGIIVIEVKYANLPGAEPAELTGYVAVVPVGLNTISSVVLSKDCAVGNQVKRGYTRLGNFLYGGSLNILLFSEGLVDGAAIKCRLGEQITMYDIGSPPPADVPGRE
ncbi:MAG: phosphatidylserine decarboxylase, partial [Phycisphaerales bacterium]|nr:phosphatidylserine decarboxylase [Phycisphaerales bacterium]